MSQTDFVIGVDLGQASDFTALTVVERVTSQGGERLHNVRHLERLPLGSSYPDQVQEMVNLAAAVEHMASQRHLRHSLRVVVDQTGVGRPVLDMLRAALSYRVSGVTITSGDTVSVDGRDFRVPKRDLVGVLQVALQNRRLRFAAGLRHTELLTRELLAFKMSYTASGNDVYGNDWRLSPHDDLVLAVALAVWSGEYPRVTAARVAELMYR